MDYEPYDSSGTDDDLPPTHQNRIQRGGHIAGNGRPAGRNSVPHPKMSGETDMEAQIHQLEQEAYSSVLRAFKAQADAITWEKESLITELRKELRLSNEEHRELLGRVNADDVIQRIREWRQSGGLQSGMHGTSHAIHDPVPSPSVSVSRKKQNMAPSLPSQSFGGPSPTFHSQSMASANLPSSSSAKRGLNMGAKGRKHKSGQMPPGGSLIKMQYPVLGPTGRGQFGNHISSGGLTYEPAEAASYDTLVGRKVRTRWPDDNNFYEAVITNYKPDEGLHALVYDIGTTNETWEWVNLADISPEDIQWVGEDPGICRHRGYGGTGHGMNRPLGRDGTTGSGRGRGFNRGLSRKEFPPSHNGIGKKGSDDILQLLNTDILIREVERVLGTSNPDPVDIEKAKTLLKEHEQALADTLVRLADISDGESDEGGHFSHRQSME
ncbi:protein EMSY-LIKE 3-like isoform X1 [Olea europaea var. sylvestris]|uniref:protein EMSY-LIKE 3-like isoform X1 n=1 Tax=Olea europaea var. sylvestris TaxID=158386 RepID=UPI000C1D1AAA|nr:protein EMSY-LIKE 3-like isoform X1 [Olea europaea var. sylvestris]XP_022876686.1 protein EMSY-LIKE 3-like isoform X1 [Olea europaea var. sylvestris]XP_022876687.1 protein EMSY-LIKE 3-like isoform X1 [Olea europaea var. sylvestris]